MIPLAQIETRSSSRQIVELQLITLLWMILECGIALVAAWKARSPALLAFGSDSFVELLSAIVVLLQFVPSFSLQPARAARLSGILLFALAGVVALSSIVALFQNTAPEVSWIGIIITLAALVIMPLLARAKRTAARRTGNRALFADSVQSATCAYLAAITLLGLLINATLHIGWIDPVAALAAIPILGVEGAKALRGEPCGCCS